MINFRTMHSFYRHYRSTFLSLLFIGALLLASWLPSRLPARALPDLIGNRAPLLLADISQDQFQQVWRGLFPDDRPPGRGTGGGRGDKFCAIAPMSPTSEAIAMVASDTPIFVWRGAVQQIQVRSADQPTPVALSPEATHPDNLVQQITYQGPALQPGQTYTWTVVTPEFTTKPFSFQVLSAAEQRQVSADLQTIASQQQAAGATAEQIAIRQAGYLADHQLWSDFWHTALSIPQPSEQLNTVLQKTADYLCSP